MKNPLRIFIACHIWFLLSYFSYLEAKNYEKQETKIDFSMSGYATVEAEGIKTTTGGTGGKVDTVKTLQQLVAYAKTREKNTNPGILIIKGYIESPTVTTVTIKHGANITILGDTGTAELKNVGLTIWDYTNVIIRNLKIHEVLYPGDALCIDECRHVWIDHNEFYSKIGAGIGVDTYDGLLDIKQGSRYVTVSWNYLHHHMKCSLIGHTDNASQAAIDQQMRITYHHNYFSNTDGRNPSLRFGALHLYNNYFENISDYGIAIRQGAHAKIENNHYESVKLPITTNKFDGPEGFACLSGNLFTGSCFESDNSITQTDCSFWDNLPYSYQPDPANVVAQLVKEHSGTGKIDTILYPSLNPGDDLQQSEDSVPKGLDMFLTNPSFTSFVQPNPVQSVVNIHFYLPKNGNIEFILFDLTGRVLIHQKVASAPRGYSSCELQVEQIQNGYYLLNIWYEKMMVSQKIFINH